MSRSLPGTFECDRAETISPKAVSGKLTDWFVVLGNVAGVYIIDESVVENGWVEIVNIQSLACCGYMQSSWMQSIVSHDRPTRPETDIRGVSQSRVAVVDGCTIRVAPI